MTSRQRRPRNLGVWKMVECVGCARKFRALPVPDWDPGQPDDRVPPHDRATGSIYEDAIREQCGGSMLRGAM